MITTSLPQRIPTVMANWKMAMTLDESRVFIREYLEEIDDIVGEIQIIISAPATAIATLASIVADIPLLDVGAQNSSAHSGLDHTGELSAHLLADAGAKWCMVGHWDVIRQLDKLDQDLNHEIHALHSACIRPIILVGESKNDKDSTTYQLEQRLETILSGIANDDMARSVIIYEPEWAIGSTSAATPERVGDSCQFIREWMGRRFDHCTAQQVPILYGGSVFPENAEALLSGSDLDGFGAGRRGRDPKKFAEITRAVYHANG